MQENNRYHIETARRNELIEESWGAAMLMWKYLPHALIGTMMAFMGFTVAFFSDYTVQTQITGAIVMIVGIVAISPYVFATVSHHEALEKLKAYNRANERK